MIKKIIFKLSSILLTLSFHTPYVCAYVYNGKKEDAFVIIVAELCISIDNGENVC